MDEVSDTGLTQALRDIATESDIDLLGVAPVSRLEGGPEGARPTDYMPSARSVVVLAKKMLDSVVEVAGRYDEEGKTLGPYMWYGYPVMNWDLSSAAARVARALEKEGFKALPFPPTGINYKFGTRADFSHRHAAVAAGPRAVRFQRAATHSGVRTEAETGLHNHRRAARTVAHAHGALAVPPGCLRTRLHQGLPHEGDDRQGDADYRWCRVRPRPAPPGEVQVALPRGGLPPHRGPHAPGPHRRRPTGRGRLHRASPVRRCAQSVHLRAAVRGLHLLLSLAEVRLTPTVETCARRLDAVSWARWSREGQ